MKTTKIKSVKINIVGDPVANKAALDRVVSDIMIARVKQMQEEQRRVG